ncbi:DUF3187 family protein [Marispirochaeta aestuarii]|uniref:DUF3187 family protein n=1 Tax=Marispirochaeta aestuarii TaxID=1963862 RepID=UPI0029C6FFAF|nr:DUF3187 family protein [Marispirochaeta aestuarii]
MMNSVSRTAPFFLLPLFLVLFFRPDPVFAHGPLRGKLLDVPHQIYYGFPGFSASQGLDRSVHARGQVYYLNEFRGYAFDPDEESLDEEGRFSDPDRARELTAMDFEALVLDSTLSFPFGRAHRMGISLRFYSYYGGFLDPAIEGFHSAFNLPNASREYFPQGKTAVSIDNDNGLTIELEGPGILPGDMEIFGIWTFSETRRTVWGLAWAVELPTGKKGTPGGNGHTDLGAQLLFEHLLGESFVLHLQQGFVVPGELIFGAGGAANPLLISQSLAGLEWLCSDAWSLLGQIRIHTSPLTSRAPLNHSLFPGPDQFEMPVTALQTGFRRSYDSWSLQIYLEQDFLTHEGPDILLSVAADWRIGSRN